MGTGHSAFELGAIQVMVRRRNAVTTHLVNQVRPLQVRCLPQAPRLVIGGHARGVSCSPSSSSWASGPGADLVEDGLNRSSGMGRRQAADRHGVSCHGPLEALGMSREIGRAAVVDTARQAIAAAITSCLDWLIGSNNDPRRAN